jgi:nitrite reductase/ring-hydroxylating ferredoxin subunit
VPDHSELNPEPNPTAALSANPDANPARPRRGAAIAQIEDIPDPGAIVRHFTSDSAFFSMLLTRSGTQVFAFENRCAHANYPLERHDGVVVVQEGRYIVCTAHGASFTFAGECAGGPCNGGSLRPIAVTISNGRIEIA